MLSPGISKKILETQKETGERFGDIAIAQKLVAPTEVEAAIQKQASGHRKTTYVKVLNERLNSLVDMVGELVVNQSMLRLSMAKTEGRQESADRAVAQLETVTTGIKDLVLSMGMVSVAEVFNKLRVVIRNTATETGKLVAPVFSGEDTELDRNIIETIYDPLVHLVRNAIDHGLEGPADREAAGKSRVGTLELKAGYRGNGIELTIRDDGAGIDRDRVLAKAVKVGLVTEAQTASMKDREVFELLFLPGFSTRDVATEISGRGVGLDVVKQNIDQIHGKVEIDSTLGQGARFTIRLPLTLAIIDGFVTRIEDTYYVFPFSLIEEIIVPRADLLRVLDDGEPFDLFPGSPRSGHPCGDGLRPSGLRQPGRPGPGRKSRPPHGNRRLPVRDRGRRHRGQTRDRHQKFERGSSGDRSLLGRGPCSVTATSGLWSIPKSSF